MVWFVVIIALMIPLIAVILDSALVRALVVRLENDKGVGGDAFAKRVSMLEGEIERLNGEVLRLDEETAFLHKLLENKTPAPPAELPTGEREG